MKKILALVLAVAMLSTVAFAGAVEIKAFGASTLANPTDTITIAPSGFSAGLSTLIKDYRFSNEYLAISSQKFSKGANLVKSVKINDDDMVVEIAFNTNYELIAPTNGNANVVIDKIAVKGRKNGFKVGSAWTQAGDVKKNEIYSLNDTVSKNLFVGYTVNEKFLGTDATYLDGKLVKFVTGTDKTIVYDTASATIGDVYMEGRVYDKDKVFVEVGYKANTEVLKANENASIRFINIVTSGLPTSNTLILTAEEKEFIYKMDEKGVLTPSGLTWSADDYGWKGKIRSSTSYVISDVALKSVAAAPGADATTPNPNTGANDVVGIAAALAVVSLVAAGAVSLKK